MSPPTQDHLRGLIEVHPSLTSLTTGPQTDPHQQVPLIHQINQETAPTAETQILLLTDSSTPTSLSESSSVESPSPITPSDDQVRRHPILVPPIRNRPTYIPLLISHSPKTRPSLERMYNQRRQNPRKMGKSPCKNVSPQSYANISHWGLDPDRPFGHDTPRERYIPSSFFLLNVVSVTFTQNTLNVCLSREYSLIL